jgi:two-component system, OmpR family, sensor histidine kinase KdpD
MRTRLLLGTAASAGAVAVVTAVIYALDPVAPVLGLGVLYLFAVLPVAAVWGLRLAIPVSIVSILAFDFFFLPPRYTFHLAESEDWVALAVYLGTAVFVSALATSARRRAGEAEEQRREAATKTALLRSVSHDLRSPLTAIGTASEMLAEGNSRLDQANRDELLASIRAEARRLDRLVGNLLDQSRLEAGAASPSPELWTVDSLVAQALEAVGRDGERIEVSLPDPCPAVRVDAAQIERVLVNLLENALGHSSPADPVEIRVETRGGEVVIAVVDRGPGIAPADREAIFEPFRGSGRGTGLGLAIARGFAELNAGRIAVEPGNGTTFSLVLPAVEIPSRVTA